MLTAKRPQLRRLWMIDRELRSGKYPTVDQLAALAEVDEKTIRRDITSLQNDHLAPVKYCHKRRGWFYSDATYRLPAVVVTEGELVAMHIAGQVLQAAQETPYAAELQRAIHKLSEFLPDEVSLHWQTLDQAQSFRQSVTTLQDIDIFRQLADAVLKHHQLRIRYWTASRDAESERIIDPYHLACVNGEFFLLAYCYERKSTRMFSPGRIRELTLTGETFQIPSDFQVDDFFDGAFKVVAENHLPEQTVRLRFQGYAARYAVAKRWHCSQKLEKHDDGSVTLEFSLRSMIEVRRWILSWGSECEVLAPAQLRADILREAEAMLKQSVQIPARKPVESSLEALQKRQERRRSGTRKRIG